MTDQIYSIVNCLLFIAILFLFIFVNHGYINNDGILYLSDAFVYQKDIGLTQYQWNFYSYLIANVSKIFNCNLYISAKIIVFFSYLFTFFTLVGILNLKKKSMVESFGISISGLLLFYSFLYTYSQYILRDHLFWTCNFIFYYLLIYMYLNNKFYEYKLHLLIILTITFGSFFRVEMLLFLIYPLVILFNNHKISIKNYTKFNIFKFLFILLSFISLLILCLTYYPESKIAVSFSELINKDNKYFIVIPQNNNLEHLIESSSHLEITIFIDLFKKLLKILFLPTVLLFVFYIISRSDLCESFKKNSYILLLIIPFSLVYYFLVYFYASNTYITSSRYLITVAIPLFIIILFLMSDVLTGKYFDFKKHLLVSLVFLLVISFVYKFFIYKVKENELISYLKENFPDIEIISNDPRLEFYAGKKYLLNRPHDVSLRHDQSYLINTNKDKFYDINNLEFIKNELFFYQLPSGFDKYKLYLNLKHYDQANKPDYSD